MVSFDNVCTLVHVYALCDHSALSLDFFGVKGYSGDIKLAHYV